MTDCDAKEREGAEQAGGGGADKAKKVSFFLSFPVIEELNF